MWQQAGPHALTRFRRFTNHVGVIGAADCSNVTSVVQWSGTYTCWRRAAALLALLRRALQALSSLLREGTVSSGTLLLVRAGGAAAAIAAAAARLLLAGLRTCRLPALLSPLLLSLLLL